MANAEPDGVGDRTEPTTGALDAEVAAQPGIQPFDPLDEATEDGLRASIKEHGVVVAITADADGNIIDGHHRYRIAGEEGQECPVSVLFVGEHPPSGFDRRVREALPWGRPITTRKVLSLDPLALALTLNFDRRHLTSDQRRAMVIDLHRKGYSQRIIARVLDISQSTVQRDLRAIDPDESVGAPSKTKGLDGKLRAARRPKRAPTPTDRPASSAQPSTENGPLTEHREPPSMPPLVEQSTAPDVNATPSASASVTDAVSVGSESANPTVQTSPARLDPNPPEPSASPNDLLQEIAQLVDQIELALEPIDWTQHPYERDRMTTTLIGVRDGLNMATGLIPVSGDLP